MREQLQVLETYWSVQQEKELQSTNWKRTHDLDYPIKPPHLDGSLGSFTMPATFSVPAGCLNASEEFTRWAANYGMIAAVMWTSSSPKGQSSQCSIQKSRISSAVSFLVPKNTGDLCPVIHLSHLNGHLVIPQFKMETQASVRSSIRESKWTMSIDIPDAYLHVPMARPAWKYLWFMVNGRACQFSLAISPWEFTKAARWLQGVKLNVYLDCWLICTSSPVQARTHANLVLQVLQHLRWVINFSESDLPPSQQFNFISMQFSMCTYIMASLPQLGVKIQNTLDHCRSHPRVTARDLHRLLGMLTFMATLVLRGQPCLCTIQWWASEAWCQETGSWSDRISVTQTILHRVAWWPSPAMLQGISLSALETEITLFINISSHRWGHSWAPISCKGRCPGSRQASPSIY